MSSISKVIHQFPMELQEPVMCFWDVINEEIGVKREDFKELKDIVFELAEAQKRTEIRLEELAIAQKGTELAIQKFAKEFDYKIGGLGTRWGLGSEASFRNGLREILSDTGYEIINFNKKDKKGKVFGYPEYVEIDIIVKNGTVIAVEIKSSSKKHDVCLFIRKVKYYEQISNKKVEKMVLITPFIDSIGKETAKKYNVLVCDTIYEIDEKI